jgi:hypothetical protein
MKKQHPNLNYEFYFLFQVKCNDANEPWREPASFSNEFIQDNLHSIRIDKDKRLFRYAPPPAETGELPPLNEWEAHLQQGWAQIQACYQDAFQSQAFMGVALLILDESVAAHQIQCNTTDGTVTFKSVTEKTPNEKILLKVTDGFGELMDLLETPVTLEEFEPDDHPATDWSSLQIQLSSSQLPRLAPMQIGEIYPNPIFAVYGLAHGILPTEVAEQLQTFLCSGKVALMWRVLSRLMMQKWQFKRLDMAAYQLRQKIDSQNDRYRQVPDARLECASNKKLEWDLRDMTQMDAEAKQVLARVDAGGKTLEINRYNLERHLQRSGQVWQYLDKKTPEEKKYDWTLEWQNDMETPLLDGFYLNIRHLRNHATYIQDALAYLDGIRTRWQLYLDGRRLQYESHIQIMLLVLTFIASFAGVVALIIQYPDDVALLLQVFSDNPERIAQIGRILLIGISFLILIIFVLQFSYLYLNSLWKKFRCWLQQLRERLF